MTILILCVYCTAAAVGIVAVKVMAPTAAEVRALMARAYVLERRLLQQIGEPPPPYGPHWLRSRRFHAAHWRERIAAAERRLSEALGAADLREGADL